MLGYANAMFRLLEIHESLRDEREGEDAVLVSTALAAAARKGCQALNIFATELGEHNEFSARVEDAMYPTDEGYRGVLDDPIALNRFLLAEEQVMVAAGMDPVLARETFGYARLLVGEVRSGREPSMERLQKRADKLAHHACVEADMLIASLPPEPGPDARRLRWFLYGLAGVAVIAVNVTADALLLQASFGAVPLGVVSKVSVHVGDAVLGGALVGALGEESAAG